MEEDDDISINKAQRSLTYMPWYEHLTSFLVSQWKEFLLVAVALFGMFWGVIEAANFFYPTDGLSNGYALATFLAVCSVGSLVHSIYKYRASVPEGLENESLVAQKIAFSKPVYWEYGLAYELLNNRISKIDRDLEDVLNNRVHIKVSKVLDVLEYSNWIQTRPETLIGLANVSRQLLIIDLIDALHADDSGNVDFVKLLRVIDLIADAYRSAYEYEIEGREIKVPEGFELVHEIQSGWVPPVRDGFCQMLDLLKSTANRKKDDSSPLKQTIEFGEPPRVDEFCEELDRLAQIIEEKGYL